MLNGLSLRDERYFYVPSPVMEPSEPRVVHGIVEAHVVRQLEGGVLLEASTGGGTVASVLLQLVGKSEALRCRVRAEGIAEEMRLVLGAQFRAISCPGDCVPRKRDHCRQQSKCRGATAPVRDHCDFGKPPPRPRPYDRRRKRPVGLSPRSGSPY